MLQLVQLVNLPTAVMTSTQACWVARPERYMSIESVMGNSIFFCRSIRCTLQPLLDTALNYRYSMCKVSAHQQP